MAIPYLGSKRKSAGKIYSTIKNHNPTSDTLVDLFCGGLAISEYFLKNGWRVIANDKNKYVIALLDQIINKGLDEDVVCKFVTRDHFIDVLTHTDKYDDWYVGYVMCIYSFGNNQKEYMFGKDVEPYKHAGHDLVVHLDPEPIQVLMPKIPQKYIDAILKLKDWHVRRLALSKVSRQLKTRVLELQQLEQLQQLQRLEQLERLQQLEQLELMSRDYKDAKIPSEAIIYCDPPYKGTEEYREGGFNHDEFWNYVRELSKTNRVYVSEYTAPSDFRVILEFDQNSTYAGGQNKSQPSEKLFTAQLPQTNSNGQ